MPLPARSFPPRGGNDAWVAQEANPSPLRPRPSPLALGRGAVAGATRRGVEARCNSDGLSDSLSRSLPLPAPAKQTHHAEAGGEERESGWQGRRIDVSIKSKSSVLKSRD